MWTRFESPSRPSRRTFTFLIFAVVLAVTTSVTAQTRTLRLASTPWSPFTNEPGKARFALDLVHKALERMGIKADTAIIAEGRLTPALINGEFDGSAALWKDDARQKALIYSC